MKFKNKQKHMIDFIFPVLLFFVFALCALTVLLLAARIYQSAAENSFLNYTAGTGLSYISEKVRRSDAQGGIRIGELDGQDALVMEQSDNGAVYYTYIYAYDGSIRELFVKEGVSADPSVGTKILEVKDFSMEEAGENLLRFDCTDKKDRKESVFVSVKSK